MSHFHVVLGAAMSAAALLGQSASFTPQQIVTTNASGAFSVAVADLDGDNDLDVISASEYDGKIAWYENIGSATYGPQRVLTGPGAGASGARCVFAADLDGDNDIDVLSASFNDDKIAWYENLGGGTFGSKQVISTSADFCTDVRAADLDGDNDLDVLSASSYDDTVGWYENLGGGVFGARQAITTNAYFARTTFVADLDDDGDEDVLSASQFDDKIAWYENLGGGVFGAEQPITTTALGAWSVFAADVDDDGDIDVLSASGDDATIAWYANDGSGSFGPQQVLSTSALSARCVYAADLDDDGDMDVLSASRSNHTVAKHKNLQVHAVPATATAYGTGCGDPAMVFTPTSNAVIGQSLSGQVVNTPTAVCAVAFGSSNTFMPGFGPLPFDLGSYGMEGCMLYQSSDVLVLPTTSAGVPITASFSLPVPADPLLVCQHIYFQAFSYAPGVNPRDAVASNGLDFLIGNQ